MCQTAKRFQLGIRDIETSAFGNVRKGLKQKNPLRDKVLTDSIEVIS
jgi:hypothetical protein